MTHHNALPNPNSLPNRVAAFEAGRRVGQKEERERIAAERQQQSQQQDESAGPELSLDAIRRGEFTDDEIIAMKPAIDRLLTEGQS